jgi:hypothetical protein
MAERAPASYADAVVKAQALIHKGRLADPGEHYPYKHADITELIEANPPAGPNGPDDDRVRITDLTSTAIADASRDYVEAQAAYLTDPGEDTKAAYDVAKSLLVEARQRHRRERDGFAVIAFRGAE